MCSTIMGVQCGGGTTSARTLVCSTDQAHHQYERGTSSVRRTLMFYNTMNFINLFVAKVKEKEHLIYDFHTRENE